MPEPSMDISRPDAVPAAGAGRDDEAGRWPLLETVHSSLIGLMVAFMGFAPRTIPLMLGVVALVTLIEVWRSGSSVGVMAASIFRQVPLQAALALLAFAAISTLWAADRRLALQSVLQVTSVVLVTGTLTALLPGHIASLPPRRRNRFVRAVPLGGAMGLGFILAEFATGNAISLALVAHFPTLSTESAKVVVRQGDKVMGFVPFYLDRNVAAATLALPAVLLAVRGWLVPRLAVWAIGLALMAAVTALSLSWSGAAQLAAVCGVVAALVAVRWPTRTPQVLMVAAALGIGLALPLGHLPSKFGLETAAWLAPSARERAMIWDRTATAAARTPLLGIGVQSTRFQDSGELVRIEGVKGPRRELGWHAHNVVLQTWLEMGAVGALLLLGVCIASLRSLGRLDPMRAPAAVALFVMASAVGLTGWGMWQPWLMSVVGAALACLWITDGSARAQSD